MKKSSPFLLALALIFYPISGYPGAPHTPSYAPGEILVKFKEGLSKEYTRGIYRSLGFKTLEQDKRMPIERIKIPDGWSVQEAVSFYRADPDVEYAEPNYIRRAFLTPHDPYFPELWGLHNTGQTGGEVDADIDAREAWDIGTDCASVVIAVLDTGADLNHEDLKESIWRNTGEDWVDESPGNNSEDDDGNGKIDDYWGWDFVNDNSDPEDDNSEYDSYHGTHVTGIIAARGSNNIGITGVCWSASVMILKILDSDGTGYVDKEIEAINYAIENGAKIINLSLGGSLYSQSEYDAIEAARDKGVLVIAAAGNGGYDQIGDNINEKETPEYPASYDLDNIISVTATDHNDGLPAWANYGLTSVDVAAPGVEIYSTKASNTYQPLDGTSMATPHVAGLAALIWAYNGPLTYDQAKGIIFNGVDPTPSLERKILTGGRINAYRSLLNDTLAAPANFYATAISASQIDLSWNDISHEESGFEIERKEGLDGTYVSIKTIYANDYVGNVSLSYSDTGLQEPFTYYYRAKAFKNGIESYSWEAHAPHAPSNLTSNWVYPDQIDLSWQDNANDEAGFKIERRLGTGGAYAEVATVGAGATNYSDTGLKIGIEYWYRMRAYHAHGTSLYSNEASSTTFYPGGGDDHGCFIATLTHLSEDHP